MNTMIQKPKGTEDFLPESMAKRNAIFKILRAAAIKYGFSEVSTPAFETLELLTMKEGDEIKEQIFVLEKRSKESFGLRFDLTVPITRMFLDGQKAFTKPVKWFSLDRMWRYEKPQKGRMREFYQLSVELFGADSIASDAEIISLAIDCLKSFELTEKDFYMNVNNRVLLQSLITPFLGKTKIEEVLPVIDKRAKVSANDFLEMLKEAGIKDPKEVVKILDTPLEKLEPQSEEAKKAVEDMKTLMKLLGEKKKFIKFDLSTARGLAYYTGIVFEVFDKGGKFRAILGGGRYDKMVEQFGGESCPATGFGLGYTTLSLLLDDKNLLPKSEIGVDYYIIPVSKNEQEEAMRIANTLREKFSVDLDLMGRSLQKQMKFANKINAKNVIVLGEEEVKTNKLTIKNMQTGKEEKTTLKELLR